MVLAALASLVSPAESSLPAAKVATAKPPPTKTVPPTPLPETAAAIPSPMNAGQQPQTLTDWLRWSGPMYITEPPTPLV